MTTKSEFIKSLTSFEDIRVLLAASLDRALPEMQDTKGALLPHINNSTLIRSSIVEIPDSDPILDPTPLLRGVVLDSGCREEVLTHVLSLLGLPPGNSDYEKDMLKESKERLNLVDETLVLGKIIVGFVASLIWSHQLDHMLSAVPDDEEIPEAIQEAIETSLEVSEIAAMSGFQAAISLLCDVGSIQTQISAAKRSHLILKNESKNWEE